MRLLTNFPRLCFLLVLLSIVGLCVAQANMQLLLVAGALAVISWYVTEGPRGRSLPRWVSNVLVIGITLHVLFDLLQAGSDVLESVSWFALWLTLIKLYERRVPRDHAQLMLLSFLLMLIASLQSAELRFGLILVIYAGLGLYVLVLYQLYAAHDQARRKRHAAVPDGARFVPSTKPIIGRSPAIQFRTLVVGLGVSGFALSVVAFIAFPRGLGETVFGDLSHRGSRSVPGFTDRIDLLHGNRITDSRREVMRVQLFDESGAPRRPFGPAMLLKGAVLDSYEGDGRWVMTDRMWHVHHSASDEFRPFAPRRTSELPEWTMHVNMIAESRTICTANRLISLRTDAPRSLQYAPTLGVIRAAADTEAFGSYAFKFDIAPKVLAGFPERGENADWRVALRRLRNERVAALAEDILSDAELPVEPPPLPEAGVGRWGDRPSFPEEYWEWQRAAAEAFVQYLRTSPFTYSIDLSHIVRRADAGGASDPIVDFLFEHQRGHCEYFASALMSLCYNAGIESRLITGYVVPSYDGTDETFPVLERNAHAWVEVRTGMNEWQTFDPTPAQVFHEFHATGATRADRLRWLYDRFDTAWNRTFVQYDSRTQSRLAERWEFDLGERAERAVNRIKLWLNDLNRLFRFRPATYLWLALIGLAAVLASMVLIQLARRLMRLREVLRLRHVRRRQSHWMIRQLGFYLDMLTVLDRAKLRKPAWQPPMQFARELASSHPDEAAIVERVAHGFYRARYGQQPLTQEELRDMRAGVRQLAERLGVRL